MAVHDRFVAVNGDHPMTAEDDAYARENFVAATPEAMTLMLEARLPLPAYVLSDGTPMVPEAHGSPPRSRAGSSGCTTGSSPSGRTTRLPGSGSGSATCPVSTPASTRRLRCGSSR
jgi:hypothetical protein